MQYTARYGVDGRVRRLAAGTILIAFCTMAAGGAAAVESGVGAAASQRRDVLRQDGTVGPGAPLRGQAPPGSARPVVVAVESFVNVSQNSEDAWLGAGIAETVAADLDALGLRVLGASAGAGERGEPAAGPAAREARWIVTGAYQRLGERLRITARLVEVASGDIVQSVRLDGELGDVFTLQDRIVAELTAGFDPAAGAGTPAGTVARRGGEGRVPPGSGQRQGGPPGGAQASPSDSAVRPSAPSPAGAASPSPPSPTAGRGSAGALEGIILPPPVGEGAGPISSAGGTPLPGAAAAAGGPAGAGNRAASGTLPPGGNPATASGTPPGGNPATASGAAPAAAATPAAGILTGRPAVQPTRTSDPPRIDGRLDDAVWRQAARITTFVQQQPLDGAPATERTQLYVAYDTQNLYFGMHVHYSDRRLMRANRSDRDQTFSDDTITLYFDPFLDQQRAYVFSVNGYGVQGDAILDASTPASGMGGGGRRSGGGGGGSSGGGSSSGGGPGGMTASLAAALGGPPTGDTSWDALFASSGRLVDDGWTAEMTIPFKSLRYPSRGRGESHRWGFQVVRSIGGKNETDVWAPISRDVAGFLPQMGLLDGLTDLSTSRNLEILPTLTAIQFGSLDTATGVFEDGDPDPEGGLNVKYGVTPNLTFDYTYNPDFSQIESDIPQIEVNQRFPLFYPELRPFFLEGQEIFQVPGQVNLVHTRTIVDPRQGAKLTGKVGNTTLGVLVANDEAPGRLDDTADPAYGRTAQVAIARARYDLYAESYLGVIATDRQFLDGYNRVAGVDGRFRLGRTASVSFQAAESQRRSAEDGEESGPIFHLGFDRAGRNLSYSAAVDSVDPGFRTDTGFVQRVDTRVAQANVSYRWWPENWIVNWGPLASYSRNYDFAGRLQDEQANVGARGVMKSSMIWVAMANRDMERYEGIEFFKTTAFLGGGFAASRRLSAGGFLNWGDQIRYGDDPFLGAGATSTLFASIRPVSRLAADLNFITSRLHDPRTGEQVFDVRIYRARTTWQFTNRLLFRNILEFNAFTGALAANLLFTYRVNAGTVFFVGYDDHYQQGDRIDGAIFPTARLEQTNRAIFTKLSYLFRF